MKREKGYYWGTWKKCDFRGAGFKVPSSGAERCPQLSYPDPQPNRIMQRIADWLPIDSSVGPSGSISNPRIW